MNTSVQYSGKDIYSCFFKLHSENKHQCNLCGILYSQHISRGYSNLKNHLDQCHSSNWKDIMKEFVADGKSTIDHYFTALVSDKAINIHSWLDWMSEDNLTYEFCTSKSTRKNVKLRPVSRNTLVKYRSRLFESVKQKIAQMLPKSFGIIIDGWTIDSSHYNAIYATFMERNVRCEILLSCNVAEEINDDTVFDENLSEEDKFFGFTAADWFDCIVNVLFQYGIEVNTDNFSSIVEFIVGDNCSVNQKLAKESGIC